MIILLLLSVTASLTVINADPGIHLRVPNSPLTIGQQVYIEYSSDAGEQGAIIIMVLGPGGGPILWSSGRMQCSPGIVQSVSVTGITNVAGTYTVGAELWLTGAREGEMISSKTTFQVIETSPFDFTIQLSPQSITVEAGDSGNFHILLTYSDPSHAGTIINIQVTGLGPGMTYQLSASGNLKISTSSVTPPGSYPIIVVGSAQGVSRQTSGTIIVTTKTSSTTQTTTATITTPTQTQQPIGDFTIVSSPQDISILQGETAPFTLTIDKIGDFNEPVSFTGIYGHPSDTTPDLKPEDGHPRFTATLIISTYESTQPGTYLVTVEASGGGKTHSTTITLIIKEKPSETSIATEPPTETHAETIITETTATELGFSNLFSNPLALGVIVIAALAGGLIATLSRKGRTPSPQKLRASTGFCAKCGIPLKSGNNFCTSCGEPIE